MFSQKSFIILLVSSLSLLFDPTYAAKGPAIYSEAADVFEFIDNASAWNTQTSKAYRSAIETKYKLTSEDNSLLKKYAELRKKEYENSDMNATKISKDDAFGPVPFGFDHFSNAFYSHSSIREALLALRKSGVAQEDILFLSELFKTFLPKIKSFIQESAQFPVKLIDFNRTWKSTGRARALKLFEDFVLGKLAREFNLKMLPVWSPTGVLPSIDIRGRYLILRYNPLTQTDNWDFTDALKKSVLAVLYAQPLTQRENLSKLFKLKCNGREYEFQEALQIVFGAMLPMYTKQRKKFNLYERWSSRTFIDVYAKILFPLMESHVKNKGTFSGFFMEQSSFLCRQLHQLAIRP